MNILPDAPALLSIVAIAIVMNAVSIWLPTKAAAAASILLAAAALTGVFVCYPTGQAILLAAIGSHAYIAFSELIDRDKREMSSALQQKLRQVRSVEMVQRKDARRLAADLALTALASLGAMLFFGLAPETYAALKVLVVFMTISVSLQTVRRVADFYSARLYWLPEEGRLIVLSRFQPRDFPLRELKEASIWSSADLLKMHPLFTFLSSYQDYTRSFGQTLKLSFPGETVYVSPDDAVHWHRLLAAFASHRAGGKEKKVLPLWHPAVLKRLFWKGYFAAAVKGVSAYTGLLALLFWLKAPAWTIALFPVLWWLLNFCVSDRVLIAAMDAEPLSEGVVVQRAQAIFRKAGIPRTRLFSVDSPDYNGFAAGMNIGRGAIILTTATLRLPAPSIEAILAHEAAHIRKRDVLAIQLARFLFIGLLAGAAYLFFDPLKWFAEHFKLAMFVLIYAVMLIFPMFLSFVAQWTEVRADFAGAAWLRGGTLQMAQGLTDLAAAQDRDLEKSLAHRMADGRSSPSSASILERDSWFWRFLEFQFMAHPPLYWRINCLTRERNWREARRRWLRDRFKESLPG